MSVLPGLDICLTLTLGYASCGLCQRPYSCQETRVARLVGASDLLSRRKPEGRSHDLRLRGV